jgi:flavodoxin
MKILVVYYSRSGVTRIVAQAITKILDADLEEIIDLQYRKGPIGFLKSCLDAVRKKPSAIKPAQKNPEVYDLIILCTPVWAATMSCAMRTYIRSYKDKCKNCAFVCTTQSSGFLSTFENMEKECGKKPLATLALKTKQVRKDKFIVPVKQFTETLL